MKNKEASNIVIRKGSLALFTGREDSIAEFSEKLNSLLAGMKDKGNTADAINNYGIGGIGKSTLNSMFNQIIDTKNKALVRNKKIMTLPLDFSSYTLPKDIINKMMVRLQTKYGKRDFLCTKYAKFVLHEKYGEDYEFMNELNKDILPSSKAFDTTMAFVEFFAPYGGVTGFIHKIASIFLGKKIIQSIPFIK